MLATVGGSPKQASEVARLVVDGVDQLLSAQPSQWETLRKSSKVEVCLDDPWLLLSQNAFTNPRRLFPGPVRHHHAFQANCQSYEIRGRSLHCRQSGPLVSLHLSTHHTMPKH